MPHVYHGFNETTFCVVIQCHPQSAHAKSTASVNVLLNWFYSLEVLSCYAEGDLSHNHILHCCAGVGNLGAHMLLKIWRGWQSSTAISILLKLLRNWIVSRGGLPILKGTHIHKADPPHMLPIFCQLSHTTNKSSPTLKAICLRKKYYDWPPYVRHSNLHSFGWPNKYLVSFCLLLPNFYSQPFQLMCNCN